MWVASLCMAGNSKLRIGLCCCGPAQRKHLAIPAASKHGHGAGRICLLSKERGQGRLVSPNSGAMSDLSIAAKPYVPVARASPELRRSPTTVFHEPLYSLSPALPPHLSPGRARSPDLMQLRPQLSPPPAPPPPAPFENWLQHAASVALANPLSRPVPAWA